MGKILGSFRGTFGQFYEELLGCYSGNLVQLGALNISVGKLVQIYMAFTWRLQQGDSGSW